MRLPWRPAPARAANPAAAGACAADAPPAAAPGPAEEIRPWVDGAWYGQRYPDVAAAGIDPVLHYWCNGAAEGRAPCAFFDPRWYAGEAGVGNDAGVEPLRHWIRHGAAAGRDPHPLFDAAWVRARVDCAAAGGDPLLAWLRLPAGERPPPSPEMELFGALGAEELLALEDVPDHPRAAEWRHGLRQAAERWLAPWLVDGAAALASLDSRPPPPGWPALPPGAPVSVRVHSRGNLFFAEVAGLLVAGFAAAGFTARLEHEDAPPPRDGALLLVVAPHELFFLHDAGGARVPRELARDAVLLDLEQPGTEWFLRSLRVARLARGVLHLGLQAAAGMAALGLPARHLPLGYVPGHAPFAATGRLPDAVRLRAFGEAVRRPPPPLAAPLASRPLDLLFVGAESPRRHRVLARLAPRLASFASCLQLVPNEGPIVGARAAELPSAAVVGLARRARVVLNLHQTDLPFFEWHRIVFHGLWQGALVVSEPCLPTPWFTPGRHYLEAPAEEIPDVLDWLAASAEGRATAERVRREGHRRLVEEVLLAPALRRLFAAPVAAPVGAEVVA